MGWRELRHPIENIALVLSVAAVFGIPTTLGVWRGVGPAGVIVGLLVGLAVISLEGAYRLWHDSAERDRVADVSYTACSTWIGEVEQFLEVRGASCPVEPRRADLHGNLARKMLEGTSNPIAAEPEVLASRKAIAAHDRETVALFIERYRNRGLPLFDTLVSLEVLKASDATRENLRSPKTRHQINDAVFTLRLGAESDLRRFLWSVTTDLIDLGCRGRSRDSNASPISSLS